MPGSKNYSLYRNPMLNLMSMLEENQKCVGRGKSSDKIVSADIWMAILCLSLQKCKDEGVIPNFVALRFKKKISQQ